MQSFNLGDTVVITATCGKPPSDPLSVQFTVISPVTHYAILHTYPSPSVARVTMGIYALSVPTTERGEWWIDCVTEDPLGLPLRFKFNVI